MFLIKIGHLAFHKLEGLYKTREVYVRLCVRERESVCTHKWTLTYKLQSNKNKYFPKSSGYILQNVPSHKIRKTHAVQFDAF